MNKIHGNETAEMRLLNHPHIEEAQKFGKKQVREEKKVCSLCGEELYGEGFEDPYEEKFFCFFCAKEHLEKLYAQATFGERCRLFGVEKIHLQ